MYSKKINLFYYTKEILCSCMVLFFTQRIQAQRIENIHSYYSKRQAVVEFDKGFIVNNEDIVLNTKLYINKIFANYDLKFQSIRKSPFSIHILFQQYDNLLPVYQSSIMVNIANSGRVLSVINNLIDKKNTKSIETNLPANQIFFDGEKSLAVFVDSLINDVGLIERVHFNNQLIYTNVLSSYLNPIDTTVKAKVFNPDPITAANVAYGGNYSDMNDSDLIELNNQMQFKDLKLKYDSGFFIFENDRVKIVRISPVVYYDTAVKNRVPVYGRGNKNFEGLNCIYHITQANDYINKLSFNLGNHQIWVDPHGRSDDNSAFTNDGQSRYLKFGDGGIDDAEDADPIIHEYHHDIFDDASQGGNVGLYRKSIEEGSCDFAAASYSKSITTNQWQKVYNWDGNNSPIWLGRTVQTSKKYPHDLNSNIYNNGEMWSTFLMDLEGSLGRDYLHKLLYQSFYSAGININDTNMAMLLLQSDTLINGAANCWKICMHLTQSNRWNCGTPVQQIDKQNFDIINTDQFVSVNNTTEKMLNLSLFSIDGKLISQQYIAVNALFLLSKSELSKGVYILHISNQDINYTKKFTVY